MVIIIVMYNVNSKLHREEAKCSRFFFSLRKKKSSGWVIALNDKWRWIVTIHLPGVFWLWVGNFRKKKKSVNWFLKWNWWKQKAKRGALAPTVCSAHLSGGVNLIQSSIKGLSFCVLSIIMLRDKMVGEWGSSPPANTNTIPRCVAEPTRPMIIN